MSWLALIQAALEGLASVKFLWQKIEKIDIDAHLNKIYEHQQILAQAYLEMGGADLPQERKDALKGIVDSWKH